MLDKHSDQGNECGPLVHIQALSTLSERFENHFSSLRDLKPFLSLLSNPSEFDLSKCGVVYQRLGVDKRKFEEELIHVCALDEDKINQLKRKGIRELYLNTPGPILRHYIAKLMSIFGSTYTCEQTFSAMGHIKCKKCSRLTDGNLSAELQSVCTFLTPNLRKLMEDRSNQKLH